MSAESQTVITIPWFLYFHLFIWFIMFLQFLQFLILFRLPLFHTIPPMTTPPPRRQAKLADTPLALTVPQRTAFLLRAWKAVRTKPQWRIFADAMELFTTSAPADEREDVERLVRRLTAQQRPPPGRRRP